MRNMHTWRQRQSLLANLHWHYYEFRINGALAYKNEDITAAISVVLRKICYEICCGRMGKSS